MSDSDSDLEPTKLESINLDNAQEPEEEPKDQVTFASLVSLFISTKQSIKFFNFLNFKGSC